MGALYQERLADWPSVVTYFDFAYIETEERRQRYRQSDKVKSNTGRQIK
jgi:hypothetical protein